MKLLDLYHHSVAELSTVMESGTASFETYCLLEKVFGWDKHAVLRHKEEEVSEEQVSAYISLLERRKGGYPLQYLLGSWEFWGYDFLVGEGVLIPRADTEILCETVLELAKEFLMPKIADLCSGSGCLPVVYAMQMPQSKVTAVELSDEALPYLLKNVERYGCDNVTVLHQDALTWEPEQKLHIISSNPPYISAEEINELQTEVTYEPRMALEAPENGLYFYRVLSQRCWNFLVDGGVLAFEVGWKQAEAVADLMKAAGFSEIIVRKDYGGNDRVVWGRKREKQEG